MKERDRKIVKLENENQKLKTEVTRLKNQNKKDSSNSNKPSGTNGYKKVITNRREKSDKKQGGQEGHQGNSLGKERLEKILNKENIKINKPVEINKNEKNKNLKPYKTTVIDINIEVTATEYLYYPDENGNFNVPQKHKKQELPKSTLINFKSFMGIMIKDGTDLYNGFGIGFSQCISHIQRYLKGIYDFIDHKGQREMAIFLTKYNNYRKELIQKGKKIWK